MKGCSQGTILGAVPIGDKAYVGLGRSNQMWEYDPSRE